MNRRNARKLLLCLAAAIVASIVMVHTLVGGGAISAVASPDPQKEVATLFDRTQWHQVNSSPYYISPQVNVLCAAPTPIQHGDTRNQNPHADTAITVFVNARGRDAMLSPTPLPFPVGSVIVKQKMDPKDRQATPLLYTVMIKRPLAYNPRAGGWEFAVVSGDGQQTQARGTLATCMSCHVPQRRNDYVFRTYLNSAPQ